MNLLDSVVVLFFYFLFALLYFYLLFFTNIYTQLKAFILLVFE